jgi:PAS domain S-box-containing protein
MNRPYWLDDAQYSEFQVLWSNREYAVFRAVRASAEAAEPILMVAPVSMQPRPPYRARLTHEYSLRDQLAGDWAAEPRELTRKSGRDMLVLADPGGELLSQLVGKSMEIGTFLRVAIAIATAVGEMHRGGLIHKDLKPANIIVDRTASKAWLTGFGIASCLPQDVHTPNSAELAGSLAYMAPEQTGHIDRPIDTRSDLYSLGVTFYEILTGTLPFLESDPHQLIHAHIARNPPDPAERLPGIPKAISAVILKLLAKSADERYQSAGGLLADLRYCAERWAMSGEIPPFEPGKQDTRNHILLREELYGRTAELEQLNAAWDRVKAEGVSELVLVSGYSGVGKSALVDRLRSRAMAGGGLFAAGKFDQYNRDIPFAPLADAFAGLIRRLVGADAADLHQWASALSEALGANGQLVVNLVPELARIIGDQPPVPSLSGPESKKRFLLVLRQFLGVFARHNHPLVLFLDDLQWLDSATLDVFEYLATQPDIGHLLLIGAYRDNEVTPGHPLEDCLRTIRQSRTRVKEMALRNLERGDVAQLITDALGGGSDIIGPLAEAVFTKTGGNPFFTIQFLAQLVDEGLLTYEVAAGAWQCASEHIQAKKVSDNVVDLMMDRLRRLPPASVVALQHLACLGNRVEVLTLCHALDLSREKIQRLLDVPLRSGLVLSIDSAYAFAHDRIQEAVYALLPRSERSRMHYLIGTRLLGALDEVALDVQLFEVVSQLNRSEDLGSRPEVRVRAASLNLSAARKARASAAYASALAYLVQARSLLGKDAWRDQYRLAFSVALEEAECTFLSGDFDKTGALIETTLNRAVDNTDKAAIYRLKVEFHVVMSQNDEAVQSGLAGLRLFGVDFPPHPELEDVQREYNTIWANLGDRPIECLIEQPAMTDLQMLSVMRLLAEIWPPANFTDINLTSLAICRMVNITLTHGAASASRQGIALLGWLMGPVFSNYADGYRLVLLALDLVSQEGNPVDIARTTDTVALTASWSQPLPVAIDLWRKAHKLGVEAGDRYFACYSCAHAALQLFISGRPLRDIASECDSYLSFARSIDFPDGIDLVLGTTRAIACLRGQTQGLHDLNGPDFNQDAFEARLTGDRVRVVVSWYWTRKTMLDFLAGDYEAALASADKVPPGPYIKIVLLQQLDYHYYAALALAIRMEQAVDETRDALRERLLSHHQQIKMWAEQTGSPTFADKHALVSAEIARLDGDVLEAERLYEESIRLARDNGFLQNEGVANEMAARFYEGRGLATIERAYLAAARDCFLRWGAEAKVRQLDELHPEIAQEAYTAKAGYAPDAISTTIMPVDRLDVATIIKISQAISGEIVLERLIDSLMRLAIEHAGARRAVLLLVRDAEPATVAEARVSGEAVVVQLSDTPPENPALPDSIIRYALRSKESVVISDASAENAFSFDPYLRQYSARSILCLPLVNRAKTIGLLYLENDLAARIFTPDRLAVLSLLASQAAISLENSQLYKDLAEREGQIRRLVDSNVIGVVIWDLDGRLIDANDAFLRMLQYEREDLATGLRWFDMTPPDWQEVHATAELEELQTTGAMQAREKEFFRKDGSRVPVLIGAAAFEHRPDQGVAYILDLTALKQAEAEARESERRYREAQAELAHANRLTTMGQMAGSIVHEVTQPIAATGINAATALRWLRRQEPDLSSVEGALNKITRDVTRAREVIDRFREMIKKATPKMDVLDINVPIRQVIELTHPEATKAGVLLRADLTDGLPPIRGDRVQLQQVVLNLILNAIEAICGVQDGARDVVIRTAPDDTGDVRVIVLDTGPGIDSGSKERIFDTFYTTKSSGMGMGLSICRSIIEAHQGRFSVSSNEPRGAVFQFTLPTWNGVAAEHPG